MTDTLKTIDALPDGARRGTRNQTTKREGQSKKENTMKRIVETTEKSGFEELLGERVIIFSLNYIYTGKLIGVNDTCVLLDEAQIVYETGVMTEPGFKDAQPLPHSQWYISLSTVESFGRAL